MKRFAALIALTLVTSIAASASAQQFPQIRWKFGMQVSLTGNGNMKGLYVNYVNQNGPAAQAGLRVGDVILSSNGYSFQNAFNDAHGVTMLQNSVNSGSGIPTATTFDTNSSGSASLVVMRNGQQGQIVVYPHSNGNGIPTNVGFPNPPAPFPGNGGSCQGGGGGGGFPTNPGLPTTTNR